MNDFPVWTVGGILLAKGNGGSCYMGTNWIIKLLATMQSGKNSWTWCKLLLFFCRFCLLVRFSRDRHRQKWDCHYRWRLSIVILSRDDRDRVRITGIKCSYRPDSMGIPAKVTSI
jgi:hypothetical protein